MAEYIGEGNLFKIMEITYCDRCGKNRDEQRGNERWIQLIGIIDGDSYRFGKYDLCPECWKVVHATFEARVKPPRPYLHDCPKT